MAITIDREELAWAAGFFDGEGCTTNARAGSKSNLVRPRMSINQNHREVLDRFQRAVGMGTVTGPHPRKGGGNPYYRYDVSGAIKVQAVVVMLWGFLGTMKRNQATSVLQKAHWERPLLNRVKCNRGHDYAGNRTKYGQCRKCMQISDQRRR